jgi:hypothetical protein
LLVIGGALSVRNASGGKKKYVPLCSDINSGVADAGSDMILLSPKSVSLICDLLHGKKKVITYIVNKERKDERKKKPNLR